MELRDLRFGRFLPLGQTFLEPLGLVPPQPDVLFGLLAHGRDLLLDLDEGLPNLGLRLQFGVGHQPGRASFRGIHSPGNQEFAGHEAPGEAGPQEQNRHHHGRHVNLLTLFKKAKTPSKRPNPATCSATRRESGMDAEANG